MQILVNGEESEVSPNTSIADLLQQLERDPRTLAVERNMELVPRDQHADTLLEDGDRIEVVTLVGGG